MIKDFINKNYKKYSFCFLLNIMLLFFTALFFYLTFESNDDLAMKRIVSGVYGFNDYHMVFSNAILGHLLSWLYSSFSSFSWYEITQYIFILFSLTQITYIIFNKKESQYIFISLLVFTAINLYSKLQFTKTASVLTFAGVLTVIDYISNERANSNVYTGIIFMILGFIVRSKQFLACLVLCAAFYLPFFNIKDIKKTLIICILCVSPVFILHTYDSNCYKTDEWKEYVDFNMQRGQLLDGELIDYKANKEYISNLGLTQNAFILCMNWDFNDPQIYTTSVFENLNYLKTYNSFNNKILSSFSRANSFIFEEQDTVIYMLFVFLIIYLFINQHNRKSIVSCTLGIMCLFAEILACVYIQETVATRVVYPLIMSSMVLLLYFSNFKMSSRSNLVNCLYFVILMYFIISFNYDSIKCINEDSQKKYGNSKNVFNSSYVYVSDVLSQKFFTNQSLFVIENSKNISNVIPLGGWETQNPNLLRRQKRYGITNPYVDMVDNDNVYLVTSETNVDLITDYIKDYYYDRVYYEFIDQVYGDIYIYKLVKW